MSWLESIITFLNDNSGAITAIATVVLVAITGWYVRLTKHMLKATNTPIVRLFLHGSKHSFTLCVQNIGTGFARDIKFTGDLSFKTFNFMGESEVPLEELEPFNNGIEYLGPGHKVETFLFGREDLMSVPDHNFDITVTYKDLANIKDEKTFTFEIGNWGNTDQYSYPHTDETANALEDIARILENMGSDNLGSYSLNQTLSTIQDTPKADALERIANALEKISSK